MICFLQHQDSLDRDLLLKADSERLQTSMPEVEFEPADYGTKWQHPTIRPSLGRAMRGQKLLSYQKNALHRFY